MKTMKIDRNIKLSVTIKPRLKLKEICTVIFKLFKNTTLTI